MPNSFPFWELHLCKSCECLEPWLERKKNTKLGPQNTIKMVLKCKCLKCPCIVHLNLICMSYDNKERAGIKLGIWLLTTNPLKVRVKWGLIGACYMPLERYFQGYKIMLCIFTKQVWFENDMTVQRFGTSTWEFRGKLTFGCSPCG